MNSLNPPKLTALLLFALSLLISVALWYFVVEKRQNQDNYHNYVTKRIHRQLIQSYEELEGFSEEGSFENEGFTHPTFLYQNGELISWNDYRLVPPIQEVDDTDPFQYLELNYGKYLKICRTWDDFILVQIVLLHSTPEFTNQYIQESYNQDFFPAPTLSVDIAGNEESDIVDLEGKPLFGITFDLESNMISPGTQFNIGLIFLFACLCLLIYLNQWCWYLGHNNKPWVGLGLLIFGLVSLRVAFFQGPFPYSIYPFDLFNSRYYASSLYNPSLGDLLINVIFLVSLSTYVFQFVIKSLEGVRKRTGFGLLVLLNLAGLLALALLYGLLEDILTNSQITLDINQSLEFSIFKTTSFVIFFLSSIIWVQVSHVIYVASKGVDKKLLAMCFLVAAALYVLVAVYFGWELILILLAQVVYLLLIFSFRLPEYFSGLRYTTLFYFFAASLISSSVGTMAIYENYEFKELIDKQRFANDLLIENDLRGEYLIQQASTEIKEDIFIQSRMMSPLLSTDQIEQKIRRDYLGGYFDKYDLNVHLYDKSGIPFGSIDNDSLLTDIQKLYSKEERYFTGYENIFFISSLDSDQPKRYLSLVPIERYNNLVGYLILDLRLKKVIPYTVFPELLVDNRFIENHRTFDYAFYDNNILNYKAGAFNYEGMFDPGLFQRPKMFSRGVERDGYHHLAIKGSNNRILVITSTVYPVSYIVSNFSFLFLAAVLGTLSLLIVRLTSISHATKLSFISKIQLYLNLAFFVPLLITSVVLINSLNSSYREEIDRSSVKKANSIKDHLVSYIDDYLQNKINRETLSSEVTDIARYSQSDLIVFDIEGRLITSSQPQIFNKKMLSTLINQNALHAIIEEDRDEVVLNESVGSLAYKTTYAAVKSFDSGELLGIVGIPFFGSKNHLRRQNVEAFTNILNIFTLVLIASLFVSNLASRLLTYPLNLLTQKIRRTSLSEHNEPLHWKGEDEIGMVVDEYNKMLVNLEESKEALAKSQKESAWREIAKQVAHEIKNPLTPMKLSLQHLKRLLENEGSNGNQYDKPIDNLLYQVDSLSDIATSFSAFAKMPIPENARFDFSAEVKRIVELFDNEDVDIVTDIPEVSLFVEGDQKLMGRTISNLIINGMQSVPSGRRPQISIKLSTSENKLTLEVADNGSGIPEEIHSKVFIPNFSTKDKGSGIGLAIAKRGIDHAGGNIWFETSEKGTSFFIDLPLAIE